MEKSVLSFKNGIFIYNGEVVDFLRASGLIAHADESAKRVLSRALVTMYPESPLKRPLPTFLDPHQRDGIHWILSRSRAYLAHAPGAGKTLQAILAAIYTESVGQVVFIVPPALSVNWQREIMKWYAKIFDYNPSAWPSIGVITESKKQSFVGWNAEFIIVPDSMLIKPWVLSKLLTMKIRFIAVDEASRFKERDSQKTKALFGGVLKDGTKSPGLVYKPHHAVLLDGSPMPNRPMELWAPVYAMAPATLDFMDQDQFGFKYCGPRQTQFGWDFRGASNQEDLHERLHKSFMHTVTEEGLSHPERLRSILFMTDDVRSLEHKTWEKKHLSAVNFSDLDDDIDSNGDMARFRRELGMRKCKWVADYVTSRINDKNESILLFAWHREVVTGLTVFLQDHHPFVVMGGTTTDNRERAIAWFQAGKCKLLIGNILALGRGHNLTRADRVIFGEFSWSDETNVQAEKRASRKGRSEFKAVRCEYICCPNSMDEPILNAVFKKAENIKRIITNVK